MALMMGSAIAFFAINYETRQLAHNVSHGEDILSKLKHDVAVYRAERAHLARPERIAPFARKLGLRPAEAHQFSDAQALRSPAGGVQ